MTPLIGALHWAGTNLQVYALAPERFAGWLEAAAPAGGAPLFQLLLQPSSAGGWVAIPDTERAWPIFLRLAKSPQPELRAVAVCRLGRSSDPEARAVVAAALEDRIPWVRRVAVQAVAREERDADRRQAVLAPRLSDPDSKLARMAALGLLEPEVIQAAGWDQALQSVELGKQQVWVSRIMVQSSEERPLAPREDRPAFLESARDRWAALGNESEELREALLLLLAQHGEFSALEGWLRNWHPSEERENWTVALTGIELSHNLKFLPFVQQLAEESKDQWRLRRLLQALRGMSGTDVRKLRVEINRRIAEATE